MPIPPGAADLSALGVTVHAGHDPSHLEGARAVVVTAAVPADHPELRRARELDLPVVPRKVALAALVGGARSVGVSGTHGKTTTTVMTTEALAAAGLRSHGTRGRAGERPGAATPGSTATTLFVVEADEYDQAFLTLHPTVAIVNNVEADHLECYGSVEALEDAFVEFAGRAGSALVSADDPGALRVGRAGRTGRRRFGFAADADVRIADVAQGADGTEATVSLARRPRRSGCGSQVPGIHNLRNAVAALARGRGAGRRARAGRRRRWRRSPAWAAGSSGWASTAASRWWTTTPTIRPSWWRRSRPRGRRFRAGGSSRSSSRTSTRAPTPMARRWGRRSPRPIWCS